MAKREKSKISRPALYTLTDGKLFVSKDKEMSLICDNCYTIPVAALERHLGINFAKLKGQSFTLQKSASCGFVFVGEFIGKIGTRTDTLMDLDKLTVLDIKKSMVDPKRFQEGFPILYYSNLSKGVFTNLTFSYDDDQWQVTKIENASLEEMCFLHSVLMKHDLIKHPCPA